LHGLPLQVHHFDRQRRVRGPTFPSFSEVAYQELTAKWR
jgi:hypothetical protein